jgi:AraC-like DNA-binding protein
MGSKLDRIGDWSNLATQAGYGALQLAELCGVSLRQLERYFKVSFGRPPQDWLNEACCREAENLLLNGLSVKAVSHRLGFKQASHFSRFFKQHSGRPPSRVRR